MNDKEYTYDIGKYTIGVDENGEDEIGLTVAKVENGEIYFLGNCYGENARCLDLLIKENQELKKQFDKNRKLEDNWNKLKEYLHNQIPTDKTVLTKHIKIFELLDKMQEIEQESDSNDSN